MAVGSCYTGRRICLTTQHGKERALARPFAAGLGACLEVCGCDTDQLGTFSGEIERRADAVATCRAKALLGLERSGLSLGLASEASFGPHPAVPLLAIGHELLQFVDLDRDLWVLEQRIELRTNFSQRLLEPGDDLNSWLQEVGFPSHAVIVRPADASQALVCKGLQARAALEAALERCRAADPGGRVRIETDMRAHHNPTRLRSIRRLGIAMARRLRSRCPACGTPGWGVLDTRPGLPCAWCGEATALVRAEVWGCPACPERRELLRGDGRLQADPAHCPACNP